MTKARQAKRERREQRSKEKRRQANIAKIGVRSNWRTQETEAIFRKFNYLVSSGALGRR